MPQYCSLRNRLQLDFNIFYMHFFCCVCGGGSGAGGAGGDGVGSF